MSTYVSLKAYASLIVQTTSGLNKDYAFNREALEVRFKEYRKDPDFVGCFVEYQDGKQFWYDRDPNKSGPTENHPWATHL